MKDLQAKILLIIILFGLLMMSHPSDVEAASASAEKAEYTEVTLNAADGVRIAANLYSRGRRQVIIVLNGSLQSKDAVFKINFCTKLAQRFDVLNIDFRGQGKSNGEYTGGIKELFDLKAAVNYVQERGYTGIGLIGFGFGGFIAVKGAALIEKINSVVTISAPYTIDRVGREVTEKSSPNIAVEFGRFLLQQFMGISHDNDEKDTNTLELYLAQMTQPIFIIHGTKDSVVPYADSRLIYATSRDPKTFMTLDGGCHAESISLAHVKLVVEKSFEWFAITLP